MADVHAFRERFELRNEAAAGGPLGGLRFAAKDVFDVAGRRVGGGSPDWLASHGPAARTAPVVQACLDAGAVLVGYTIADEMSFSPFGENEHYGTPVNPAAPDRVPGGSSSGSASATAAGEVDFALGADTAGSVRIPASFCGLFGIRPTHGRLSSAGVMPLAPSFDTPGWFAREAGLLERVGRVLLPGGGDETSSIERLLLLEETLEIAHSATRHAFEAALERVTSRIGPVRPAGLSRLRYRDWLEAYDTLRPPEIWRAHGEWIERTRPRFGSKTAARFETVRARAGADTTAAAAFRAKMQRVAGELLGDDGAFVLPTTPSIAPLKGISDRDAPELRQHIFQLSGIAPMLGFPEITLPLMQVDGYPVGLSLIGPPGGDRALLAAAVEICGAAGQPSVS